jgi:hypothetical protein
MNNKLERICKKVAIICFVVLSWHLTEENHEHPQSGQPVSQLRLKKGVCSKTRQKHFLKCSKTE